MSGCPRSDQGCGRFSRHAEPANEPGVHREAAAAPDAGAGDAPFWRQSEFSSCGSGSGSCKQQQQKQKQQQKQQQQQQQQQHSDRHVLLRTACKSSTYSLRGVSVVVFYEYTSLGDRILDESQASA